MDWKRIMKMGKAVLGAEVKLLRVLGACEISVDSE